MKVRMKKVEGNKLKIDERDIVAFDRYKAKLADDAEIVADFRVREDDFSERAFHYFHVLRDKYASAVGYDREYAKNELCHRFGITAPVIGEAPDWTPPTWGGHIIEIYGDRLMRKSLNDYTKAELTDLIEGTILACIENDVDVAETVADYRRGV